MFKVAVFITFSWIIPLLNAQQANITIPPHDVNISIGGVAEFNCTGVASSFIWDKNGQKLFDSDEGVNISSTIIVNSEEQIRNSTVTIKVTSTDSAANITCKAYFEPNLSKKNSTALLLVQGLLKPVHNLTVIPINSTTVLISWSPPFTLEGIPILGYNVTITNTTSGENETFSVDGDSTMMYYSINHPDPDCNFTVTVICINEVGPGENESVTFLRTNCFTSAIPVSNSMSYTQNFTPLISSSVVTTSPSVLPVQSADNSVVGTIIGVIVVVGVIGALLIVPIILVINKKWRKQRGCFSTVLYKPNGVQETTNNLALTSENVLKQEKHYEKQLSYPSAAFNKLSQKVLITLRQNSWPKNSKTDLDDKKTLLEKDDSKVKDFKTQLSYPSDDFNQLTIPSRQHSVP